MESYLFNHKYKTPLLSAEKKAPGQIDSTYRRDEKFLDLHGRSLNLHLGPILAVLTLDQDVELVAEMFPVGFPPVGIFLKTQSLIPGKL